MLGAVEQLDRGRSGLPIPFERITAKLRGPRSGEASGYRLRRLGGIPGRGPGVLWHQGTRFGLLRSSEGGAAVRDALRDSASLS